MLPSASPAASSLRCGKHDASIAAAEIVHDLRMRFELTKHISRNLLRLQR
jgi:hypothetical protein